MCQNRKPFSDLPRQRWAQNCPVTTLPRVLRQRGVLATLRNRRPSARLCVPLHGGVTLVCRYLVTGASHGLLLLGNLRKFGRGPHRSRILLGNLGTPVAVWLNSGFLRCRNVPAATLHPHFRMLLPGFGTFSGHKTLCKYYSIPPEYTIHHTPSKMCSFSFS